MDIVEAEEWRAIPGFEEYEISNRGRVKSLARIVSHPRHPNGMKIRERILKAYLGEVGYLVVTFYNRPVYIHRLVALVFIGHIPDNMVVNHKDGNKENNVLGNLEIATPLQNVNHAIQMGLMDTRGEANGCAKITADNARDILRSSGKSQAALATEFGVCQSHISKIRSRDRWKHLKTEGVIDGRK